MGRLCLEVLQQNVNIFFAKNGQTTAQSIKKKNWPLVGLQLLSAALEHTQLGNSIKIQLESHMLLKHILSTRTQVFVLNSQIHML